MHIYQEAVALFLVSQSMHKLHTKHWGYTNMGHMLLCSLLDAALQEFKINTWNYITEDSFK